MANGDTDAAIAEFFERGGKVQRCPPAAVVPIASGDVKRNRRQLGELRRHVAAQEARRSGAFRMYPNMRGSGK